MKRSALGLLVLQVALSQTGSWEYRQAAGNKKYDQEGERLIFLEGKGPRQALYFGLEREGEHGLFYTAVEVKDLVVGTGGKISFRVPERVLFRTRPVSIEEAEQKKTGSAGFTRDELRMEGLFQGNRLTLKCKSSNAMACPEGTMVFHKGKWAR